MKRPPCDCNACLYDDSMRDVIRARLKTHPWATSFDMLYRSMVWGFLVYGVLYLLCFLSLVAAKIVAAGAV